MRFACFFLTSSPEFYIAIEQFTRPYDGLLTTAARIGIFPDIGTILCRLGHMSSGYLVKVLWILLTFQWTGAVLWAQWRPARLDHLGPPEGFKYWTFDIAQDSTGYMYFATEMGLLRYDGHEVELFAHRPDDTTSIRPGNINCMVYGSDHKLWLGSRVNGLNRFDPVTMTFRHFPTPNAAKFNYDAIKSICEDAEGNLWVGGEGFSLFRFDRNSETYETYSPDWSEVRHHEQGQTVLDIFQDRFHPERLWFGVDGYPVEGRIFPWVTALVSFNKITKTFESHPCSGGPKFQEADGTLWLATWGIQKYNPKTRTTLHDPLIIPYSNGPISPLVRDIQSDGHEVMVAVPYAILGGVKLGSYSTLALDHELGVVESIFVDAQGNTWFGRSNGVTVLRAKKEAIRYFSLEASGVQNRIYPARYMYHPQHHALWIVNHAIGEDGRTIIEVPLDPQQPTNAKGMDFVVSGLAIDKSGAVWITGNGQFYKQSGKSLGSPHTHVTLPCSKQYTTPRYLTVSPEGWMGGISRDQFIWFSPEQQRCHVIYRHDLARDERSDGSIGFLGFHWRDQHKAFVFSNEVYDIDLLTGAVRQLSFPLDAEWARLREINSVIEDTRGHLWVSTLTTISEFVVRNDSLILQRYYSPADGLVSSWTNENYPDTEGRIWMFAPNGMNAINPTTGEIRTFGVNEGLHESFVDPWYLVETSDGSIISSNSKGFILFHPDSLWNAYDHSTVPVVIKQIRIAGMPIPYAGDVNFLSHIHLRPHQSYVDVQFQALAYPTDYNLTYSYKLEGLHDDWISIGENKIVTLSSLPPGPYTLRIKTGSAASHGTEKILHIFKATPLVQQTWFWLLCILLLGTVTIALIRRRIRIIRTEEERKAEITKQMAELELKALRSQMNPHFMFNSLNSIKNYILQAQPTLAAEYLSNFAHLIRMILQHSREKSITLEDELETLLLYIELEKIRFEDKFEFNCVVEDGLLLGQIMIPPMLLQPFVENAIWHGLMHKKGKGHLMLSFSKRESMVACTIDDDGVGRNKAAEMKSMTATKYKSMGMGITRDRIEIMNRMDTLGIRVEVIDKKDADGKPAGTRVKLFIPGENES